MFKIISFEQKYKDDLIFCLLLAKDALGRTPALNTDLLDIQKNYFDNGDAFWIAIDDNDRVVGMLGVKTVSPTEMWLKRLYIKPSLKRKGIGSALISTAEKYAHLKGIRKIHTRFPDSYEEAAHFYPEKGFVKAGTSDGLNHLVKNI